MVPGQSVCGYQRRRLSEPANNLGACHGQTLARANVERNSLPAPGVDLQFQCGKRFSLRSLPHPTLLAIAAKLAANQLLRIDRIDRSQDLYLFVADSLAVNSDGRLHREIGEHLKQMVLNDIANCPGLIVESA